MSDAKGNAEKLRNAIKSDNKNKEEIINIVTSMSSNQERVQAKEAYKAAYGKDLLEDLQSQLSGSVKTVVTAMFYSPIDYDCITLRESMKGLGTDEDTLIEILASRDGKTLKKIIEKYPLVTDSKNLVEEVKDETSSDFQKLCVALLEGNRSENTSPNEEECQKLADELYEAGENKLGTDEEKFIQIFTTKSPLEIQCIAKLYHKKTQHTLLDVLNGEFRAEMRKCLTAILYAVLSPSEYFATRIHTALEGLGSNDKILIRVLITRAEIDMDKIKKYYKILYSKEMDEDIKGDTSGDFRKILLKLAGY